MEKITTSAEIKLAIQNLQFEHEVQGALLKQHFFDVFESLKPINLIKSTLQEVTASPYLIDSVLSSTMGLLSGYVSKKLAIGGSKNVMRNIVGSLLQFGVTNVVSKNSGILKTLGNFVIKHVVHRNENKDKEHD